MDAEPARGGQWLLALPWRQAESDLRWASRRLHDYLKVITGKVRRAGGEGRLPPRPGDATCCSSLAGRGISCLNRPMREVSRRPWGAIEFVRLGILLTSPDVCTIRDDGVIRVTVPGWRERMCENEPNYATFARSYMVAEFIRPSE